MTQEKKNKIIDVICESVLNFQSDLDQIIYEYDIINETDSFFKLKIYNCNVEFHKIFWKYSSERMIPIGDNPYSSYNFYLVVDNNMFYESESNDKILKCYLHLVTYIENSKKDNLDKLYDKLKSKNLFELEVGKDYKCLLDDVIVIDRKGDTDNIGFFDDTFRTNLNCGTYKEWRDATKEEVIEVLKKECIKRFGEDWENIKVINNKIGNCSVTDLNKNNFNVKICIHPENGWEIWNINGVLYANGEWNEPLEEITLPKKWEDIKDIKGYWIDGESKVNYHNSYQSAVEENKNLCHTEEQAIGLLALAQLTQLLAIYNNGWVPNWSDYNTKKWTIRIGHNGLLEKGYETHVVKFLSFKTEELRDEFYDNFKNLIFKAKPFL